MLNNLSDDSLKTLNTLRLQIQKQESLIKTELSKLDSLYEQVTNTVRNSTPVGSKVQTKEYKGSDKLLIDAYVCKLGHIQHKLNRIVHPTLVVTTSDTEKPYTPNVILDDDYWDVEVGNVRKYLNNIAKEHQKRRSYNRDKDKYFAENII